MFRSILSADPRHADSLHMMGVLALQTGHAEIALTWFDRAIAASPRLDADELDRLAGRVNDERWWEFRQRNGFTLYLPREGGN